NRLNETGSRRKRGEVCVLAGYIEVMVVQDVEEFTPELESHTLGDFEVLVNTEVEGPVIRAEERIAPDAGLRGVQGALSIGNSRRMADGKITEPKGWVDVWVP